MGARETYYTQRLESSTTQPLGVAVSDPINRNVANASLEVRPPTLSRIFDHKPFGRVLKHTIEPFAIYRYQTGINDFSQIIRFDERDILADTNEVEYGVINRLYSKKTSSAAQVLSAIRNTTSWPGLYRKPRKSTAEKTARSAMTTPARRWTW